MKTRIEKSIDAAMDAARIIVAQGRHADGAVALQKGLLLLLAPASWRSRSCRRLQRKGAPHSSALTLARQEAPEERRGHWHV